VGTTETTVVIDLPVRTVYDQWTQFEEFPEFMANVQEVRQLDDTHLHWVAKIYGIKREWDAEITQQTPDQCVAWQSTDGPENSGVVRFEPIEDDKTRVVLDLRFEPEGIGEKVVQKTGIAADRAKHDLKSFKKFIEKRGGETGAWRGKVEEGQRKGRLSAEPKLMDLTKEELYAQAKVKGISGRSSMSKSDLASALRQAD